MSDHVRRSVSQSVSINARGVLGQVEEVVQQCLLCASAKHVELVNHEDDCAMSCAPTTECVDDVSEVLLKCLTVRPYTCMCDSNSCDARLSASASLAPQRPSLSLGACIGLGFRVRRWHCCCSCVGSPWRGRVRSGRADSDWRLRHISGCISLGQCSCRCGFRVDG